MSSSAHQNLTDRLADFSWRVIEEIFQPGGKHSRPPVYFFLSPQSRGSLKNRSLYEVDLVHRQQYLGEGLTLKYPPAAYVSELSQVAEETAHLFALTFQRSTQQTVQKQKRHSAPVELWSMTLHECFGLFCSRIILGNERIQKGLTSWPAKKKILHPGDLWEAAHREGYTLGEKLADAYFCGTVTRKELQRWFQLNWYATPRPTALLYVYKMLEQSPTSPYFSKPFQIDT